MNNEIIKKHIKQAEILKNLPCLKTDVEYAEFDFGSKEDVMKLLELVIRECAEVGTDNFNSGFCPVGEFILKHYGLEK